MESRVSPLLRPYLSLSIFILAEKDTDVEDLNALIREVNVTQVRETEILADHAYYYDCAKQQLT